MTPMVVRGDCFDVCRNITPGSVPLIVTDPPYGRIVAAAWDRTWTLKDQWILTAWVERLLVPGGTAYVWGGIGRPKDRLFFAWLAELETRFGDLHIHDVITWGKRRAYGTDHRYLFCREECAMLVKGDKPRTFNVPLLDEKRGYPGFNKEYPAKSEYKRRTNVWTDVPELFQGKIHQCEKPSRLAEIMIETSSNPGELVLDMFAGSGSAGVAATKLGRPSVLIELSDCPMHSFEGLAHE